MSSRVGKYSRMRRKPRTPKSERTRQALLDAGRDLFSARGYDRTTIRDIAALAGVDPAMVMRYFGSKEALFAEAAIFRLGLPNLANVARSLVGETLLRHFLNVWEGEHAGLAVLLRSAGTNAHAAGRVREIFSKQVQTALAAIGDPTDASRRAGLVSSQLLGLALCRYVLKLPPVTQLSPEDLVAHIGPVLQKYATGA